MEKRNPTFEIYLALLAREGDRSRPFAETAKEAFAAKEAFDRAARDHSGYDAKNWLT